MPEDIDGVTPEHVEETSKVDYQSGNIIICGEITNDTWEQFTTVYLPLMQTKQPVSVLINSGGGDPMAACGIYDLIRASPNEVAICGFGLVASAATIIFQAGSRRLLAPNATFMIHGVSVNVEGSFSSRDIETQSEETNRLSQNLFKILASRSKLTAKKIKEMCAKDCYMSAQEAVKWGFADGIIKKMAMGK